MYRRSRSSRLRSRAGTATSACSEKPCTHAHRREVSCSVSSTVTRSPMRSTARPTLRPVATRPMTEAPYSAGADAAPAAAQGPEARQARDPAVQGPGRDDARDAQVDHARPQEAAAHPGVDPRPAGHPSVRSRTSWARTRGRATSSSWSAPPRRMRSTCEREGPSGRAWLRAAPIRGQGSTCTPVRRSQAARAAVSLHRSPSARAGAARGARRRLPQRARGAGSRPAPRSCRCRRSSERLDTRGVAPGPGVRGRREGLPRLRGPSAGAAIEARKAGSPGSSTRPLDSVARQAAEIRGSRPLRSFRASFFRVWLS
jgi:hypothetical protein